MCPVGSEHFVVQIWLTLGLSTWYFPALQCPLGSHARTPKRSSAQDLIWFRRMNLFLEWLQPRWERESRIFPKKCFLLSWHRLRYCWWLCLLPFFPSSLPPSKECSLSRLLNRTTDEPKREEEWENLLNYVCTCDVRRRWSFVSCVPFRRLLYDFPAGFTSRAAH